jgi:glycosyltransferase involved in cell wall biosynthesis
MSDATAGIASGMPYNAAVTSSGRRSGRRPRTIRVCHVMSADLWAGAEVQVATVASYLVHQPDVTLTAVLFNDGPLADELKRLGVPVLVIDERRHNPLQILLALIRFLRAHPQDVVHTHRNKDNVVGALAAKLAGVPCVIRTVHGRAEPMSGWQRTKYRAYEALDGIALRRAADRVIAVSRSVAETLESAGCASASIVQIANGIDVEKLRRGRAPELVRQELGVNPGAPFIGTVGRLSPVKGHIHFLRAARLVLDREPAARFLIVGDGPLRSELAAEAARLGIDRACVFTGSRTDVRDLIGALDIFVLPSLDEGIPMALLEAMALGKPAVATAVGGVPEILTDRVTGMLVAPGDERALADACLELLRDATLTREVRTRATSLVEQRFSHERNGRAIADLYRDVVAQRMAVATRVAGA